jgi:2-hydroxyglutarate dehydrogenase
MDGSVWLGPNAILAFKREGYSWTDFDLKDLVDSVRYRGFQKLALKYAGFGVGEMIRSTFISLQLKELRKFIPNIGPSDITRYVPSPRPQFLSYEYKIWSTTKSS